MTLHKRHTHGHVFTGEEAREMLAMHKRDSHGTAIKMNVPEGFTIQNKEAVATTSVEAVQTAVSVVYVTLPQTFSGPAVYSTLTGGNTASSTTADAVFGAAAQPTDSSSPSQDTASPSNSGSGNNNNNNNNALQTSGAFGSAASSAVATSSAFMVGGGASTTQGPTMVAGAPLQATRPASSSSPVSQDGSSNGSGTSDGMSGGAKAGLAFGIILAIALVAGLVFFCWRRRKNPNHEEIVDEKHTSFVDAKARSMESRNRNSVQSEKVPTSLRSVRTASTAPRLSLRPVTQFLPNLTGESSNNHGNTLGVAGAGLAGSDKAKSWDRRPSNAANPFDDSTAATEKPRSQSPQNNPFEESENKPADARSNASGPSSAKITPRTSWSGSESSSTNGAKIGNASVVPVAANGAPNSNSPPRGPNNVHRVQLDFKPSMDDELELRSGQLVRMLHEYDDGWALCIRMDRSQQGVAPRTCLSKLPVKPRPQGPPPQSNPNSRPGTAQGGPPRGPPNPQAPPSITGAMYPRPLTPTQSNRDRAQNAPQGEAPAPTSPNGSSLPSRKPVPGQAM